MSEETKEEKLQRMRDFVQLMCLANDPSINESEIQELEAIAKLRQLKNEIYNKEEPIPIGDIHGDSLLFLGWMLSSGAATIDQNNPIIEHRTKNSSGEDIITNIFNLKPNPDFNGKLVFLGDYIDRGPDSEAILLTLINFLNDQKVQGLDNVVSILGNHEINILKRVDDSAIKMELENNLQLFKLIHVIGDNNIFTY